MLLECLSAGLLLHQQLKRHQSINRATGAEWGMGPIDQSHEHSFSHTSTPTDKAVRLDCSFAMALSPLYVTPRAKTISPLGRMSSCHSVPQQCCPSPHLWPCSVQPTDHFSTRGLVRKWHRNKPRWQVRHFRLYYLLAGHSSAAFLRQNGELLSVVLIFLQYWFPSCLLLGVVFLWRARVKQQPWCSCSGITAV